MIGSKMGHGDGRAGHVVWLRVTGLAWLLPCLCLCLALACGAPGAPNREDLAGTAPNILLILVDDLGWRDPAFMGSDFFETPAMDRLASEGLVFTEAYACAGNCMPSRACLMSGQYTPRHGIYAVGQSTRGNLGQMRVLAAHNHSQLDGRFETLGEALGDAGYDTGFFGKWHIGTREGNAPGDQGFATVLDVPSGATGDTEDPKWMRAITDAAIEFIELEREAPFFAFVSHHAPHVPFEASDEWVDAFASRPTGELHDDRLFAAMLAELDHHVGRLLARLEASGLAGDTIVVLASDNGGLPGNDQAPLRGSKGMYYDGGIRVPMVVRWPDVVVAGDETDVPTSNVDLYPTFVEIAGGKVAAETELDGESLLGAFIGGRDLADRPLFWHFPGYLEKGKEGSRDPHFRSRPVSVIRRGTAKLHLFHEEWSLDGGWDAIDSNRAVELYDLSNDVGEANDLATTDTVRRDALLGELLDWIDDVGAPMASRPNGFYSPPQ